MAVTINGTTYQWVVRDSTGNLLNTGPVIATGSANPEGVNMAASTGSGSSSSSSTSTTGGGGTVAAPDNSDVRNKLVGLIQTTTDAYNKLMQAGRDNDAFALRDAMERYARAGTQIGVNSWARTQSINDLRARMAASAGVLQGTTTAQALAAQADLLGKVGALDATTFNQTLAAKGANLETSKFEESKSQNAWQRQQYLNNLAAQQAEQRKQQTQVQRDVVRPSSTPNTGNAFVQPPATPYEFNWNRSPYVARPGEPSMGRDVQAFTAGLQKGSTRGLNWGM